VTSWLISTSFPCSQRTAGRQTRTPSSGPRQSRWSSASSFCAGGRQVRVSGAVQHHAGDHRLFRRLEIGYPATCCRLTFAQTMSPKIRRDMQENTQPILVDDPRVLAVPIRECGEPLVDLCEYLLLTTTSHPKARNQAETRLHCREGVAQRLWRADARLPEGIRLLMIVECHRPLELQDAYWEDQLESLRGDTPIGPRTSSPKRTRSSSPHRRSFRPIRRRER
jgi:hypothetical protein